MSSSSTKSGKKSSGLLAIVKRKKSKKASSTQEPILPLTEEQKEPVSSEATKMSESAELSRQLAEAFEDLDLAETKIEEDAKKIAALEDEIKSLHKKSQELESKVTEMEKVSADIDDESFDTAKEFQYQQQIEELQQQLDKRRNLEKKLSDTNLELQEVRAQYEAVQFQKQRSTTREKMKSLSNEASSKEEVLRLQKEVRAAERKLQQQQATYEAKLKANLESMQRVQDKNKAIQKKCDEMEKEQLQLRMEKTRLEKKIEKSDTYKEKKRIKVEQEAAEMELKNMKRKHAKLEKRLSMSTQMLNVISRGSSIILDEHEEDSPASPASEMSPSSSGVSSPVPSMTLSEARILNLEKEMQQLESQLSLANEENQKLRDRATTAESNVESLTKKLKEVDSELFHEKKANNSLEIEAESLRQQATTPSSSVGDDDFLQAQIKKLEREVEQNEVKFRVKEKDLWSTIEAQKRQITELEMEKIALEERLLEDDATDVEEDETAAKPSASSKRVEALEEELKLVSEENIELRAEVEKLQNEAREIMESLETELGDSIDGSQVDAIKQENQELKKTLEEKSEQYVDTIREIARLKSIIEDQVSKLSACRSAKMN